ncbi:MAG: hypothetical protein V4463_05220 [Pseudomonadota bacterium]
MTAELTIAGLDELAFCLNGLSGRIVKNILAAGLRQASNVIKDQAKANFDGVVGPSELSGALRASIRTTQRRGTADRVVFNVVAGTLTAAQVRKFGPESPYYALWVEQGHINRKMHDALFGTKRFRAYQRSVSESNTPAHPYLRPAAVQKSQAALDILVYTIGARLPEVAK